MTTLHDQIAQDQAAAASAQSTLRTKRRVRRNLTPPIEPGQPVAETRMPGYAGLDDAVVASPPVEPASTAVILAPQTLPALMQSALTASPLDLPAEQFRAGLDRRKQNRQLLMDWLRTALVDGVDFGRVHLVSKERCEHARAGRVKECTNDWHWSKYSMFKSGAEKITGILGVTVHYPSLPAYESALLAGMELKTIFMRCELHDAAGHIVAEGVGARNIAQDYGDVNKSLKMAEKSAHIDATLRLASISDVFTQDAESIVQEVDIAAAQAETRAPAAKANPPETAARAPRGKPKPAVAPEPPPTRPAVALVGPDELKALRDRIAQHGFNENKICIWLYKNTKGTVTRLDQLNVDQSAWLLRKLDEWSTQQQAAA